MPVTTDSNRASMRDAFVTKRKTPPKATGWTLLFYIAGDSILSPTMISQLKELTDAGFQRDTNVLVYFDPNCNGRRARIFNVNAWRRDFSIREDKEAQGTQIGDGTDPFVRNIAEDCQIADEKQMPAPDTLRNFLNYGLNEFPAQNYMVFMMGHGVIVGNDTFLPDPDDNSAISLKQLGNIVKEFAQSVRQEGGPGGTPAEFHVLGLHSCSMSSVELAYELKGSARFMIGTQGPAFPGSWPYRQLLKKIFAKIQHHRDAPVGPDVYPPPVVRDILFGLQNLSFFNSEDFGQAGFSADLALCNLDDGPITNLKGHLDALVNALREGLADDAMRRNILLAHLDSQSYFGESYSDLSDLCERLRFYCGSESKIGHVCGEIMATLLDDGPNDFKRLMIFSDFFGPDYQFSHGLSIYFPWARPSNAVMNVYKKYDLNQDEKQSWGAFLEDYFEKTRRALRDVPQRTFAHAAGLHPTGSGVTPGMGSFETPPKAPAMDAPNTPDKAPAMDAPNTPDKAPAMDAPNTPDKAPAMDFLSNPDKAPAMDFLSNPDKAPAMGSTDPPKPIGMGRMAGTLIKNYSTAPIVTSRPPGNGSNGNSTGRRPEWPQRSDIHPDTFTPRRRPN